MAIATGQQIWYSPRHIEEATADSIISRFRQVMWPREEAERTLDYLRNSPALEFTDAEMDRIRESMHIGQAIGVPSEWLKEHAIYLWITEDGHLILAPAANDTTKTWRRFDAERKRMVISDGR